MFLKEKRHEFTIEGKKAFFSTGLVARKSESAVLAGMGDTVVLVTVNTSPAKDDQEYFPLGVEYMEKNYAAGKISGSRFVKRDRFPSEEAILRARMIDRSFRPRFANDFRNEVQIIAKVLSFDADNDPLIVALNAASAALMLSSAAFTEAVSGVRVGLVADQFFPMYKHTEADNMGDSALSMIVAGDGETITNIDANANEVPDDKMIEALDFGLELMKPWLAAQNDFVAMFDKDEVVKSEYVSFAVPHDLIEKVQTQFGDAIRADMQSVTYDNDKAKTQELMFEEFSGDFSKRLVKEAYEKASKLEAKKMALKEDKRIDGRKFDEIRTLDSAVGLLPKVHGTGLFTRGLTQVLTTATLGTMKEQQLVDNMTGDGEKRYMHYYIEEPFVYGSTGRPSYIPGRRAVGHGNLAEKALYPVLPSAEEFPYTMVLFSEVMSEYGSSSMGSISGSTLALMDAGVPIKTPVAGIGVGIMHNEDLSEYKLVLDMIAVEDFFGGMDFKVAGTKDGVTAIQMDTKTTGLPVSVFKEAIVLAKAGRITVLESMAKTIETPREEVSNNAPKVDSINIPQDEIGGLIGPGGKNIKAIMDSTGADFDIDDDGKVNIYATSSESMQKARKIISEYAGFDVEVGKIYEGTVDGIKDFGAFVSLSRTTSGLVHVSELADDFVKNVEDIVKLGDVVKVKVIGVDPQGKIKLSLKQAKETSKKS